MFRRLCFALAALAALSGTASAQTYTLPEIGLQSSGTVRSLAARDDSNSMMVPFASLDTSAHRWLLPSTVDAGAMTVTETGGVQKALADALAGKLPLTGGTLTGTTSLLKPGYSQFNTEDAGLVVQFGTSTAKNIRDQIPGALPQFDALQVVVDNAGPTNSAGQVTAIAGYVRGRVQNKTTGNNGYPVALFGKATCEVNDCVAWSLNTVLNDSAIAAAESGATGRVIENEIDFNVFNSTTTVIGFNMLLNSLVKDGSNNPLVSSTFGINMQKNSGSAPWNVGFNTADGAAVTALGVGPAKVSGTSISSQLVSFGYFDGASTRRTMTLSAGASFVGTTLNLTGTTGGIVAPNFGLPSGGIVQFANAAGGANINALYTDASNHLNIGASANGVYLQSNLYPSANNGAQLGSSSQYFAQTWTSQLNLAVVTPAQTSACTPGQIAADSQYMYICAGTNFWRRAPAAFVSY